MILVTGATGLVGGHLVWHLLQQNITVIATRRSSSDLEPLRKIFSFYTPQAEAFLRRIQWRMADVCDEKSITEALKGIETVYHCAAVVSLSNGGDDMINTNVKGTANIVNAALKNKVKRFCFVSSIAACGHAMGTDLIDENTELSNVEMRSAYARSKYFSEQEIWKGIRAGLNAVIVNPGVILGYSGTNKGSSELFARVRNGLPFYTNGGSGYIDVQDVVKLMVELTNSDVSGERFILVAENCSNKDVLSWMADGYGKRRPKIGINKKAMLTIGFISEMAGKILPFTPMLDRSLARSASNRAYYANHKITELTHYQFNSIEKCIKEVCKYELKQD
ncbi:MAG: NAD-dependent epimerase/dehydratase family protein [Paludibacter sp.]